MYNSVVSSGLIVLFWPRNLFQFRLPPVTCEDLVAGSDASGSVAGSDASAAAILVTGQRLRGQADKLLNSTCAIEVCLF